MPRQTGFDITAASEVMAVMALSTSLQDMRRRLGRIIVGWDVDGTPVTAEQLRAAGAMAVLIRDAIKPNLLQSCEGTPALVHAGPFGNIATGNYSVVADLIATRTGDFLVTEAGFGADMGAERFVDIKCPASGLHPDAAVVVATVRALKAHSGRFHVVAGRPLPAEMLVEDPDAVRAGGDNLRAEVANIRRFGVPAIIAINAFPSDHPSEHAAVRSIAAELGAGCAISTAYADGGRGAAELAEVVAEAAQTGDGYHRLYTDELPLAEKVERIATQVYGADGVTWSPQARRSIESCERNGLGDLAVCIAKTHLSISSDPKLKGAPTGWTMPVREVRPCAGAGFIVVVAGDVRTMPGLPRTPLVEQIDIDAEGNIVGLV